MTINEDRWKLFWDLYRSKLQMAVEKYPADYPWNAAPGMFTASVDSVAKRMESASRLGLRRVNLSGHAFRLTCKALGIRQTYKAIEAYLAGN
jgi:DNA phosphorothioation-dependent restriction protein DptG